MDSFEDPEGYDGEATVPEVGSVEVRLRGHFEPIDGTFHWWGRIQPSAALDSIHRPGSTITLTTPHGSAEGRLSDVDPWGRFRIAGQGKPPFPVD